MAGSTTAKPSNGRTRSKRQLEGAEATALGEGQSNDGEVFIAAGSPYVASATIQGTAPLLFHRWSNEDVEAKAKAAKGSAAKKSDNAEAYVYRLDNGHVGLPGIYLHNAIADYGKSRQDPRSPRKSMRDLIKAGLAPLTDLADLGSDSWDYLDQRRVVVQRNAITRTRPAFNPGWKARIELLVTLPEYLTPELVLDLVTMTGRVNGMAELRPTYGRFAVVEWKVGLEP